MKLKGINQIDQRERELLCNKSNRPKKDVTILESQHFNEVNSIELQGLYIFSDRSHWFESQIVFILREK